MFDQTANTCNVTREFRELADRFYSVDMDAINRPPIDVIPDKRGPDYDFDDDTTCASKKCSTEFLACGGNCLKIVECMKKKTDCSSQAFWADATAQQQAGALLMCSKVKCNALRNQNGLARLLYYFQLMAQNVNSKTAQECGTFCADKLCEWNTQRSQCVPSDMAIFGTSMFSNCRGYNQQGNSSTCPTTECFSLDGTCLFDLGKYFQLKYANIGSNIVQDLNLLPSAMGLCSMPNACTGFPEICDANAQGMCLIRPALVPAELMPKFQEIGGLIQACVAKTTQTGCPANDADCETGSTGVCMPSKAALTTKALEYALGAGKTQQVAGLMFAMYLNDCTQQMNCDASKVGAGIQNIMNMASQMHLKCQASPMVIGGLGKICEAASPCAGFCETKDSKCVIKKEVMDAIAGRFIADDPQQPWNGARECKKHTGATCEDFKYCKPQEMAELDLQMCIIDAQGCGTDYANCQADTQCKDTLNCIKLNGLEALSTCMTQSQCGSACIGVVTALNSCAQTKCRHCVPNFKKAFDENMDKVPMHIKKGFEMIQHNCSSLSEGTCNNGLCMYESSACKVSDKAMEFLFDNVDLKAVAHCAFKPLDKCDGFCTIGQPKNLNKKVCMPSPMAQLQLNAIKCGMPPNQDGNKPNPNAGDEFDFPKAPADLGAALKLAMDTCKAATAKDACDANECKVVLPHKPPVDPNHGSGTNTTEGGGDGGVDAATSASTSVFLGAILLIVSKFF
jgi:hypothetical protein